MLDVRTQTKVTVGALEALDPKRVIRRSFVPLARRMQARPFKIEFSARLNGRGYTEDAWSVAVAWLESTDWFRVRGRHFNQS